MSLALILRRAYIVRLFWPGAASASASARTVFLGVGVDIAGALLLAWHLNVEDVVPKRAMQRKMRQVAPKQQEAVSGVSMSARGGWAWLVQQWSGLQSESKVKVKVAESDENGLTERRFCALPNSRETKQPTAN